MQFIWWRHLSAKYSETMHNLFCQIELNESKNKTFTIDDFKKFASQKFTAFYFCFSIPIFEHSTNNNFLLTSRKIMISSVQFGPIQWVDDCCFFFISMFDPSTRHKWEIRTDERFMCKWYWLVVRLLATCIGVREMVWINIAFRLSPL